MKTNKIWKGLSLALASCAVIGFTACEDEPDKYEIAGGHPTVNYIRPVALASSDSLLTEASMGTTVCIVGDNLRSITALSFNDQSAVLNTSYMTDHTLIVTVPTEIPGNVTDKIYMVNNSNDTTTYDFHVIIPGPVVTAMSNEWAAPGEEVTIKGDYFLTYDNFPLTVNFGKSYTLPAANILGITKNAIRFTMPDNAPTGEKISVTSIYGTAEGAFMYKDSRGMLFDFDTPCYTGTVLGNNGWHARTITADETSLVGNYLVLGDAAMGADGAWNDGNFSFEYWPGDWQDPENYGSHPRMQDLADFSNPESLNLKFEMNIPESSAWSAAPMQIYFGSVTMISNGNAGTSDIYGNVLGGCNNTFFHEQGKLSRGLYMPWKDEDDLLFDTGGKWMTVTMPLSDFVWDYDGSKITSTLQSAADFGAFNIFIIKGGYNDKTALPEGVDCVPVIKIDNIRVVPNK
ncbi:MAG: IPT/TIG domain-containing protein [Prevotella sp.]|nr:IPT/TIG domain-containing protein [Prevotella sp.]